MVYYKQSLLSWLLVTYLQSFTDLWTRPVYVTLISVKVVFLFKAILYRVFVHCLVFVIGDLYIEHVGLESH